MMQLLFGCLHLFVAIGCAADILLERFVSSRKIRNQHVTIISDNKSHVWIEYNYEFYGRSTEVKRASTNFSAITLGIFNDGDYSKELLTLVKDAIDIGAKTETLWDIEDVKTNHQHLKSFNVIFYYPYNYEITESVGVEYLVPITDSRYVLVYKPSKINYTTDIFIVTFNGTLWLIFICVLGISVVLLRITTKYYHEVHQDHFLWSWIDVTFWAIAASCQQGVSYSPHKFASCVIFLQIYLLAYLQYTVFTAGITSTLLQEKPTGFIPDVYRTHFLTLNYTQDLNKVEPYARSEKVMNLEEMFQLLENRHTVGVIPKAYLLKYFNHVYDKYNLYNVVDLPYQFRRTILILKTIDTDRRTTIKRRMLNLLESGLLKKTFNDLTLRRVCSKKSRYSRASFGHIRSATMIFGGGVVISMSILIAEMIIKYCEHFH